ncbi:MAG TPA: tetratricopeptide repeat protein [Gemmatimonadaceae bacterium]|nr:tetratricopeptide repeat protein [Gemmatimonadaceae bacterium]
MSNVAKLKKKAAELEQKKQFDKALTVYVELLEQIGGQEEDADVALYNRVGDLMVRQGQVSEAVEYYEKAVDLYAEGGFFNNAIALCNKILRTSPGRASIYYKLGRISAKKGFASDAKQNYLEYADRMQKQGKLDEAFRALKEFADLCPDQDDIRLMLAEQLAKKQRNGEALEQLQVLYEKFEQEGRQAEARATLDRMKAIDPAAEPKKGGEGPKGKKGDLVFLDVTFDDKPKGGPPRRPTGGRPAQAAPNAAPKGPPPSAAKAPTDLPFLDLDSGPSAPPAAPPAAKAPAEPLIPQHGIEPSDVAEMTGSGATDFQPSIDTSFGGDALLGLESTSFSPDVVPETPPNDGLLDLEPTALGNSGILHDDVGEFGTISPLDDVAPLAMDGGLGGDELVELELSDVEAETPAPPEHDLALPGQLPTLASPGARASSAAPAAELDLIMPGDELSAGTAPQRSSGALEELEPPIVRGAPSPNGASTDLPMLDVDEPPPRRPAARPGAADPLEALRGRVMADSANAGLRRQLAEALFERGMREDGLAELELAMIGFERGNDLEGASSIADEIIRLNPNSVRHHQKRVEYAFRTSDRARLVDAYLELADALFRSGQPEKARTVYQRVLELSPDDIRAQAALSAFIEPTPAAAPRRSTATPDKKIAGTPERSGVFRRYTGEIKRSPEPELPPLPVEPKIPTDPAGFVNLGEWLKDDTPKSTRMVVQEQAPTGDEQADFADMLRAFKQGVAQNVEDEDHQSHYDLGVAYKEMGLVDEAIAEFQKALRGVEGRVRTYEALGQCFLEKSQFQVAATLLVRALSEPNHSDEQLVGVLYLLGYSNEALQQWGEALQYYQRVFAVDIEFRDVGDRIAALERVAT